MLGDSAFQTVFEINNSGDHRLLLMPVAGMFATLIGSIILIIRRKRKMAFTKGIYLPWILVITGLFCVTLSFVLWNKANDLFDIYTKGRYEIIEGRVQVLRKQHFHGHSPGDLIKINDSQFVIDYFTIGPEYKKTISRGGALRDGVFARIYHYKGDILRIDLKKDDDENVRPTEKKQNELY